MSLRRLRAPPEGFLHPEVRNPLALLCGIQPLSSLMAGRVLAPQRAHTLILGALIVTLPGEGLCNLIEDRDMGRVSWIIPGLKGAMPL